MPGKSSSFRPAYLELESQGVLVERERSLWQQYENCGLCPRDCEVNRLAGEHKFCKVAGQLKVSSFGPHFGEERPLVGSRGSGTIFFAHCNLLCCFCQNADIAHGGYGYDLSHEALSKVMLDLQKFGCHNINFVTPTHMLPHIVKALRIAIAQGLTLPLVYNTSGYDKLDTLKRLNGIIDIYMPDFKFQDVELSRKFCAGASDYPQVARAAIKEMHGQVGVLKTDERGVALRGVILRHLVLPENLAGTDRFLRWVAQELSPDTFVNLMDQYHPAYRAYRHPELARRLNSKEWDQARKWVQDYGLTNVHT